MGASSGRRARVGVSASFSVRNDRGQALVEFALVIPVLIVVILAIIQFGTAYETYLRLTDAVRVGGRAAATQATGTAACNVGPVAATVNWSGGTYTCAWQQGGSPLTMPGATGNDPAAKVTGTAPYTISIIGIPVFSGTFVTSSEERLG
jgi:Flp pilus assembly protein TadG